MVIVTPAGDIKYVFKGELLNADELIKEQDKMIQDLKDEIATKEKEMIEKDKKIANLSIKIEMLKSDLKSNRISDG